MNIHWPGDCWAAFTESIFDGKSTTRQIILKLNKLKYANNVLNYLLSQPLKLVL